MSERELNLKAAIYTGMALVAIVCLVILLNYYPIIFPIILIGLGLFVFVSVFFLIIREFIKD
jgi:fatty acid desaturase